MTARAQHTPKPPWALLTQIAEQAESHIAHKWTDPERWALRAAVESAWREGARPCTDLLAACEAALAGVEWDEHPLVTASLRAAIAKARGTP